MWVGVASIIVAITVQTLAFVYWAGKLAARVETHSKQLDRIDMKLDRHIESHND
jgi:hypothetical protein